MPIDASDAEAYAKKLKKIQKRLPKNIEKGTLNAVLFVHAELPGYPAEPPDSSYDRTGTLGRSLTALIGVAKGAISRVQALGGKVLGFVGTIINYAKYVIDKDEQTETHKKRWWNLQDEVKKLRPGIQKIYRKMMLKTFGFK